MALQFIDKLKLGGWLVEAWQKEFQTEMDPTNGQWFTNGPTGSRIGLFGGLSDTLLTELVWGTSEQVFTPHQKLADTAIVDNRNGLVTDGSTTQLSYTYSSSTTDTHQTSTAIKAGVSTTFTVKASPAGVGADWGMTFSFDTTFSWSDSHSISEGKSQTFSQNIKIQPPSGKVYQAQLVCNTNELRIPYKAIVQIKGQSEANFPGPVRGKKRWVVDAGTICGWINKFAAAGNESLSFEMDPKDRSQGIFILNGTMTASNTANFTVHIMDITDSFTGSNPPDPALGEGKLVEVLNLA